MLGVVWAIKKCRLFFAGKPFELLIDHQPLVPILNNKSCDIDSPRQQRLATKIMEYQFTAVWRPCVNHVLSRYPVDQPSAEDFEGENEIDEKFESKVVPDSQLESLRTAGQKDPVYIKLLEQVQHGFPQEKCGLDKELTAYWPVRERLWVGHVWATNCHPFGSKSKSIGNIAPRTPRPNKNNEKGSKICLLAWNWK